MYRPLSYVTVKLDTHWIETALNALAILLVKLKAECALIVINIGPLSHIDVADSTNSSHADLSISSYSSGRFHQFHNSIPGAISL